MGPRLRSLPALLRLLYLDFDGVLHSDDVSWLRKRGFVLHGEGHLFMHAPLLEAALDPWPEVRLVLSTSWVPALSFHRARRRLPPALQARVIGATWHSAMRTNPEEKALWDISSRYECILRDVLRRQPVAWAALDDDVKGWSPAHADHLVATPSQRGLGDPQAQDRLQAVLRQLHEPGRLPFPVPFGRV